MSKRYTSHAQSSLQREIARDLRTASTDAEAAMWDLLRGRRLLGLKFRRQHPVAQFVLDFYCVEAGLAIEIDGAAHHGGGEEDALRQEFLEARGIRFLRFSNEQVIDDIETVVAAIRDAARAPQDAT